jgi:hypothetical protein
MTTGKPALTSMAGRRDVAGDPIDRKPSRRAARPPQMAQRILSCATLKADAEDLARVVELTPTSPYRSCAIRAPFTATAGGPPVRDAIARVLGFDVVMNLA